MRLKSLPKSLKFDDDEHVHFNVRESFVTYI